MNPLNSVRGAIVTGVVAAVVLLFIFAQFLELGFAFDVGQRLAVARWLHIVAGVMWIGLLYYFNVAQIPALAAAAADTGGPGGAAITKYVAPRALLWFRWAALATWFTGVWYLGDNRNLASAFTLGASDGNYGNAIIGVGAWLGTIMLFNVWVLIWPNQKKILGIVSATDAEKAQARKIATLASRTNFVLSVPMLLCMGAATHGLPFLG